MTVAKKSGSFDEPFYFLLFKRLHVHAAPRRRLLHQTNHSSDTLLRVSKLIEITDRGILICHQQRRKHRSGARLAARRDAKNLERGVVIEH
jgi:hypothetical protein